MFQLSDIDQLPVGLIVRHLPAQAHAVPDDGFGGSGWRWEFRTAVSAMADAVILGFAAFRWDGERWVPRDPDNRFFTTGDFADWYDAPGGKVLAGQECADATNFCVATELAAERTKWVYVAETSSGRRVKGEAVIELLAELDEMAAAVKSPVDQLVANAAHFRKTMLQHTGRAFDYDEAAVRWLDAHVVRNRETLKTNTGAFTLAGSFFGECLRRVYGGQWVANVDGEQWGLQIDEKLVVYPFNRLYRHIIDEKRGADSLIGMFQWVGASVATALPAPPAAQARTEPAAAPQRPSAPEPAPAPAAVMEPAVPFQPRKAAWQFWKK